jgi:hypothetical protein
LISWIFSLFLEKSENEKDSENGLQSGQSKTKEKDVVVLVEAGGVEGEDVHGDLCEVVR